MNRDFRYKNYEGRKDRPSYSKASASRSERPYGDKKYPGTSRRDKDFYEPRREQKKEDSLRRHGSTTSSIGYHRSSQERHSSHRFSRQSNKSVEEYRQVITPDAPMTTSTMPTLTTTIIVKNLPFYVDQVALKLFINQQGFSPDNVRVEKRLENGYPISYGFLSFSNSMMAQSWFQGSIKFVDGLEAILEFENNSIATTSMPNFLFPSSSTAPSATMPSEMLYQTPYTTMPWVCIKCSNENTTGRQTCFKCGITKERSDDLEAKGYGLTGLVPTKTLLLRDIPENAERSDINQFLEHYRIPVPECIHLGDTKKFCLVETRSVAEAVYAMDAFERLKPFLKNREIVVSYSKVPIDVIFVQENMKKIKNTETMNVGSLQMDSRMTSIEPALPISPALIHDELLKPEIDRIKEDIKKRMAERKKRELEKKMQEITKKEAALNQKESEILTKKAKLSKSSRSDASKTKFPLKNSMTSKKEKASQTNYADHVPICLNCLKPRSKKDEELSKTEKDYEPPRLDTFEYDSSGYYFDKATGFYFDPKSEHFYDPKSKQWMFWYSKYERYFPCDGGDFRTKKEIQDGERETIMGPLALAVKTSVPINILNLSTQALRTCLAQNQLISAVLQNKIPIKEAERDLQQVYSRIQDLLKELSAEGHYHDSVDVALPPLDKFMSKGSTSSTNWSKIEEEQAVKPSTSKAISGSKREKKNSATASAQNEMGQLEGISDNEEDSTATKKKAKLSMFPEPLNITGVDPLSMQLKTLAPDGNIHEWHLLLCTRCGFIGHDSSICKNDKVDQEIVQKMLILIQLYRLTHLISNDSMELTQVTPTSSEVENNQKPATT